jgi:glycerol uptake facilitator-like aquaporin
LAQNRVPFSPSSEHYQPAVPASLVKRSAVEFSGTLLLLTAIVGSGIMGERLAGGNVAIALLANSIATGAVLVALLLAFGDVSGAHLNPVVTLCSAWRQKLPWRETPAYIGAQVLGAFSGVALANVMFDLPAVLISHHARTGWSMWIAEAVATAGLLTVIGCSARWRPSATPFAVAGYVTAAYWFFPSTSFANPAVTLARSITDTFSGIRPVDVPAFLAAQCSGAFAATVFLGWILNEENEE